MTLAQYTRDHPYRSSAGFLFLIILIVITSGIFHTAFRIEALFQIAIADLALSVIGIILINRLGWWGNAGYRTGIRFVQVPLFILPIAIAMLSLAEGIRVTTPIAVIGFALLAVLIGVAEETFFRGLILTTLLPKGTIPAIVISSFLFAAPHLLNAVGGLWDLTFTLVDTFAAFGVGVTFAALCLRTGSIWPVIGLHALFDFTAFISLGGIEIQTQSTAVILTSVIAGIILVVYGFFLLRRDIEKERTVSPVHRI
jgi:uncharacterized protein